MSRPTVKKWILPGAAAALLAGSVALYVAQAQPWISPPAVARAEVEPAVWAAIESARQAVKESPRSAEAWGRLGMVLFAHRFPADALTCFQNAERRDGRDPRWPYYLGMAQAVTDPDGAIQHWQSAVELAGAGVDAPRLRLAARSSGRRPS